MTPMVLSLSFFIYRSIFYYLAIIFDEIVPVIKSNITIRN